MVGGETDWGFVQAESGRPMAIPEAVRAILPPPPESSVGSF